MVEVSIEAIASFVQYYDQPLRCFTFGDFQLSPMVEEFEEIIGCPLGGNTFPMCKYNSRTFHLKFIDHIFSGFSDVFLK